MYNLKLITKKNIIKNLYSFYKIQNLNKNYLSEHLVEFFI